MDSNIVYAPRYIYKGRRGRCIVCDESFPLEEMVMSPHDDTYCPIHWMEWVRDNNDKM